MGLSGLEPPTSRLSGVRSNRLSYKPIESGIHLLSHAVSSIVPSADQVLTVVFGMGTGVTPRRIATGNIQLFSQLMGLSGLEPPTSRLSGVRSNRLSYKPIFN